MTVKELKELLDTRPNESEVFIRVDDGFDYMVGDCDGDSQTTLITIGDKRDPL